MILDENEQHLNEYNFRNVLMMKFYLSMKLNFLCEKLGMEKDREYFKTKVGDSLIFLARVNKFRRSGRKNKK
jgi:hypothetical protein